jgi:hypothetical protein
VDIVECIKLLKWAGYILFDVPPVVDVGRHIEVGRVRVRVEPGLDLVLIWSWGSFAFATSNTDLKEVL